MGEPTKKAPVGDGGQRQQVSADQGQVYHGAADLLQHLEAVRPAGDHQWIARCPAHDDRRPSLSLRWTGETWLIHDFGGCEPGAVLDALGLTFGDLFDEPLTHLSPVPIEQRWDYRGLLQQLDADAGTIAFTARAASEGCLDEIVWERFERARKRVERVAALAQEGKK